MIVPSVETTARRTLTIVNPATGDVTADVPQHDAEDCDRAVADASEAQAVWIRLPGERRSELLWVWSQLIDSHHDELARLDVSCTGKVLGDALVEPLPGMRATGPAAPTRCSDISSPMGPGDSPIPGSRPRGSMR